MNNLERAKIIEQAEDLIIHARRAKEIERCRNLELRLRRRLIAHYIDIAKSIKERIPAKFLITSRKPFIKFVEEQLKKLKEVEIRDILKKIYIIGKRIGFREAKVKKPLQYFRPEMEILEKEVEFEIKWDRIDEKALGQLEDFAVWSLGNIGMAIAEEINEIVETVIIKEGLRGYEAGIKIKELVGEEFRMPKAWRGSAVQYFEGIGHMVADYAREFGRLREFEEMRIEHYEIIGIKDRRTCETCHMMIGKIFTTKSGLETMRRMLKVKNTKELKKVHPWLKVKEIERRTGITARGHTTMEDSEILAKEGLNFPPYHLRCRCDFVSYFKE